MRLEGETDALLSDVASPLAPARFSSPGTGGMPRLAAFPKGFFDALISRRLTLLDWIALAGSLDLDGIELYPNFFDAFDSKSVARVRRAAEDHGLSVPMLCHSPDFTRVEPAARKAEVERTRLMLRVTAELGGRYCRVLSGQNRPGLDAREALDWVIDCLTILEPDARAAGVVMCLENHYKDGLWEYPEFAQRHERYLAILDAIDSPWLMAQYDPSNAVVAGEDPYLLLDRVLTRIGTVQASDRYLEGGSLDELRAMDRDPLQGYAPYVKHGVIGRGLNDYDRILGTLARSGYSGWISIEDGEGPTIESGMTNLRDSITFLRAKIREHFVREEP